MLGVHAYVTRESVLELQYLVVCLYVSIEVFKWWFADEQLVRQYAYCPNIDLFIVWFVFNHFRWQIVESAAECVPPTSEDSCNVMHMYMNKIHYFLFTLAADHALPTQNLPILVLHSH